MWGIIPAAGRGSRIQPLAFSKELLPVGSCIERGQERPRAVSEYLLERMILAGADKICFVISPYKSDIIDYYGGSIGGANLAYVVQPEPVGLCDAVFRALPFVADNEQVLIGLPDTIWFPEEAFRLLPRDSCSLLLFPVTQPELFDSVMTHPDGQVRKVEVKESHPHSNWIWGGLRMPGRVLRELFDLWLASQRCAQYLGTLLNAYIDAGGAVMGIRCGENYVDVGTLHGYREAIRVLAERQTVSNATVTRPDMTPRLLEVHRRVVFGK